MASRTAKIVYANLNSGEWGEKMEMRFDLEKYQSASRAVENYRIGPSGDLDRRPGTEFIVRTKDNGEAILWDFQFDTDVGYFIEVGESYMRFYKDKLQITETVNATAAARIGAGPTWDLEFTYANHNIAVGDRVTTAGFTPSTFNVTNAIVTSVPTVNTFRVTVGSDPGSPVTVLGTINQPFEVSHSYVTADLDVIQARQIKDVVIVTHETTPISVLRRLTDTTFDFAEVNFREPAFRKENLTDITIAPSGTSGAGITLTAAAPAWNPANFYPAGKYRSNGGSIYVSLEDHTSTVFATDLAAGKWELVEVFTSGNVGSYYKLGHRRDATKTEKILFDVALPATAQNGSSGWITILGGWTFVTSGVWDADIAIERRDAVTGLIETVYSGSARDGARNISIAGEEDTTTELRITVSSWAAPTVLGAEDAYAYLEASDAFIDGYAKVTAVGSATSATADVIKDFESATATDIWRESSWSERRGHPVTCGLFEQRLIFAGNTDEPLAIWLSRIGDLFNFGYGNQIADDAIAYTIPSDEQNPIKWVIGGKQILIGNAKEYGIMSSGSDDLTITPDNVTYRVQKSNGFNNIKPISVDEVVMGVERNGRRLREIAYSFSAGVTGGYVAADMNRLNSDISESGIKDIAYSQLREPYIYSVMNDGEMGVLAYNREDGIVGWSRWLTQGGYESVASIRGTDHDEVWVVRKADGSNRFIERVIPETWTDIDLAWYVDSGVLYNGAPTTTFSGLEHLEGEVVQCLGDGSPRVVLGAVTGGQITIQGADVSTAIIGKQFISRWKPMRFDIDPEGSGVAERRRVNHVNIRLYKTVGLAIGNGQVIKEIPFNATDDLMGLAIQPFTGEKRINWPSSYGATHPSKGKATDNDPIVEIYQNLPLPQTIVGAVVNLKISG
jgi:hypothetical protein